MARYMKVKKPSTAEFRWLSRWIQKAEDPQLIRRAEAVVLYAAGLSAKEIAEGLDVHPNTVYLDLHAFERQGKECVQTVPRRGAPPRITVEQRTEILRLAQIEPCELGLPQGRWSLTNLRDYVVKKRVVKRIGRERLRQILKKGASACSVSNEN